MQNTDSLWRQFERMGGFVFVLFLSLPLLISSGKPFARRVGPGTVEKIWGEEVRLSCSMGGEPLPDFDWTFYNGTGKPVNLSNGTLTAEVNMIKGSNYTVEHKIAKVNHSHTGDYTCSASNSEGGASAKIRLEVSDTLVFAGVVPVFVLVGLGSFAIVSSACIVLIEAKFSSEELKEKDEFGMKK